jgi:hypothetical protein
MSNISAQDQRISLIYLHLVLSTPRYVGKQGIRYNNLNAMNTMICFQSMTIYKGSNIKVNA